MKRFLLVFTAAALLTACGSEETPVTETPTTDTTNTTPVDTVATMVDTTTATVDTAAADTAVITTSTSGVITQEEAVVEKVENKMDFCQCVRENKRLEDALLEEEDDAKFDALMDEMTALEEQCPELRGAVNQTTMDAKKAHEARVKKCLRGS